MESVCSSGWKSIFQTSAILKAGTIVNLQIPTNFTGVGCPWNKTDAEDLFLYCSVWIFGFWEPITSDGTIIGSFNLCHLLAFNYYSNT